MKKILIAMVLFMTAGMAMAQMSPEEKKAQKEAQSKAKKEMADAMKLRDAAKTMQQEATPEKPCDFALVKEKSMQAAELIESALASGHIEEKKLFDAWFCSDEANSFVLNVELQKAAKNEPFDEALFQKSVENVSKSIQGVLKYGNPKDETQKTILPNERLKLAKCQIYYAYMMQFASQAQNNAALIAACEKYINFTKLFPEVADLITNPQPTYPQMAFNIYFTAYNMKDYAKMAEYRELALQYDDPEARTFVEGSTNQVLLAQGDTIGWVNSLKESIKSDPTSTQSENNIQNLLAYYAGKGNAELGAFSDEILQIAPDSKIANYGKGFSLFSDQKYEEAAKYFEKCIEIDPDYVDALQQAGGCYFNIGNNNNSKIAGKSFKTAAERDAAEKTVLDYFEKALPFFERVRELTPTDPNKWSYELKVIYTSLKMTDKAKEIED